MLYNFTNLTKHLTQLGYPESTGSSFKSIRVDFDSDTFNKAVREGTVKFSDEGIYLVHEGKEWKGYMYMPTYLVKKYKSLPRFHLTRCDKIEGLFLNGYGSYYKWSNNKLNDITDRETKQEYKNQKLQLCSHCQKTINAIRDTEDFFNTLDIEQTLNKTQLDIFGRPLNWDKINKAYRKEKNYTCEKCGFGGELLRSVTDREFIHTDHIIAWELLNTKRNNLQCLCILCHSQKDEIHKQNFSKPGMQKRIKRFINKYHKELEQVGNKYFTQK